MTNVEKGYDIPEFESSGKHVSFADDPVKQSHDQLENSGNSTRTVRPELTGSRIFECLFDNLAKDRPAYLDQDLCRSLKNLSSPDFFATPDINEAASIIGADEHVALILQDKNRQLSLIAATKKHVHEIEEKKKDMNLNYNKLQLEKEKSDLLIKEEDELKPDKNVSLDAYLITVTKDQEQYDNDLVKKVEKLSAKEEWLENVQVKLTKVQVELTNVHTKIKELYPANVSSDQRVHACKSCKKKMLVFKRRSIFPIANFAQQFVAEYNFPPPIFEGDDEEESVEDKESGEELEEEEEVDKAEEANEAEMAKPRS